MLAVLLPHWKQCSVSLSRYWKSVKVNHTFPIILLRVLIYLYHVCEVIIQISGAWFVYFGYSALRPHIQWNLQVRFKISPSNLFFINFPLLSRHPQAINCLLVAVAASVTNCTASTIIIQLQVGHHLIFPQLRKFSLDCLDMLVHMFTSWTFNITNLGKQSEETGFSLTAGMLRY